MTGTERNGIRMTTGQAEKYDRIIDAVEALRAARIGARQLHLGQVGFEIRQALAQSPDVTLYRYEKRDQHTHKLLEEWYSVEI